MEIIGLDLHKREAPLAIKAEDGTITDRRIATSREVTASARRVAGRYAFNNSDLVRASLRQIPLAATLV